MQDMFSFQSNKIGRKKQKACVAEQKVERKATFSYSFWSLK